MVSSADRFGQLVYKNRPVKDQDRAANGSVQVLFCDGATELVSERDWNAHKQFVFIPRSLGSRNHVTKNWHKYSQLFT
jgi:hypothetical protein